jgi:hypothetical protein
VPTIDFFEKEVKRLRERFNATFGQAKTVNMKARSLTIMAISWVDFLARTIRETSDEKRIGEMTREFCKIREAMNKFFDLFESQQERRGHGQTKDKQSIAAGG